jgi:hypothetical protein
VGLFVGVKRRSDMSPRMVIGSVILFLAFISSAVLLLNAADSRQRTIVVVKDLDVEDAVFERGVTFLKGNLNAEINIGRAGADLAKLTLDEQVKELKKLLKPECACVVAIVKEPAKTTQDRILAATNQPISVVNLTVIKDMVKVEGNDTETNEQYLRFTEKESMRAVGSLLGLKPCPNPYCAMNGGESKPVSRVLARNYCPPCQGEMDKVLPVTGERITATKTGIAR